MIEENNKYPNNLVKDIQMYWLFTLLYSYLHPPGNNINEKQ